MAADCQAGEITYWPYRPETNMDTAYYQFGGPDGTQCRFVEMALAI